MDAWVERELEGSPFPDQRLKARLGRCCATSDRALAAPCREPARTEPRPRPPTGSFDNPRVDEGVIPGGHFAATTDPFAATSGTVLVLHDTTAFRFRRDGPEKVGYLGRTRTRRTVRGLLTHSALVLATDGLPLGLGP